MILTRRKLTTKRAHLSRNGLATQEHKPIGDIDTLQAYDSMNIFSDVSIDILARNKCSLLTYLLTYLQRRQRNNKISTPSWQKLLIIRSLRTKSGRKSGRKSGLFFISMNITNGVIFKLKLRQNQFDHPMYFFCLQKSFQIQLLQQVSLFVTQFYLLLTCVDNR